jgi:hypothetical protein
MKAARLVYIIVWPFPLRVLFELIIKSKKSEEYYSSD